MTESRLGRGMRRFQSTFKRLANLSVANQISLAFLLTFVPTVIWGTVTIQRLTKQQLVEVELRQLKTEALIIKTFLDRWEDSILFELQSIANADLQSRKDQNPAAFQRLIQGLHFNQGGSRYILDITPLDAGERPRLISIQGDTITPIGNILAGLLNGTHDWVVPGKQGNRPFMVSYFSRRAGERLVAIALPIVSPAAQPNSKPKRFALALLPAKDFLTASQLNALDTLLISGSTVTSSNKSSWRSDLPGFVLTGSDGLVLLSFTSTGALIPESQFNDQSPVWQQLKQHTQLHCAADANHSNNLEQCQSRFTYNNNSYIINYTPDDINDAGFGTITVLPLAAVNERATQISWTLLQIGLTMLVVGMVVMVVFARRLAAPIQEASEAIDRLSDGEFEISLNSQPIGELRRLFASILETAERLKTLLVKERQSAVSLREIETAKTIQRNFLPETIHTTPRADVAALCEPALQVGADWYDVIPLPFGTVFVLADVCDKGVGSALFMSVFRSLIRFFVQQVFIDQPVEGCGDQERLQQVLSKVNEYMAINHGASSMFATIFMALHQPAQQQLLVVNGGHEATLLLASGSQDVQKLEASGPAVGIFNGATYRSYALPCPDNSWLLLYSDGLPDACNANQERFGHDRSERCFLEAIARSGPSSPASAEAVLAELRQAVAHFCGSEPAFDDLTIMVLHCLPGPLTDGLGDTA